MISSEVRRTLVKSPPELWAELSDPASLARHLGELGEIRITRIVPENTVEWEAEQTTGKVLLKPSGWGTKVTLTVSRESPPPPVQADTKPAAQGMKEPAVPRTTPADLATEAVPAEMPEMAEPMAEPEATAEVELARAIDPDLIAKEPVVEEPSEKATSAPEPRPGFFARFFRRRSSARAPGQQPGEPQMGPLEPDFVPGGPPREPDPTSVEQRPHADEPRDAPHVDAPAPPDVAAELKLAEEELAGEQVTAVLSAVLDRLGAAHHRPFSRA